MPESFGARLRLRREQQQIALTTIAEQTKIKLSLLEALERDDVSRWPGGIFRRAFVRTYALAIGLDADATVREFVELYPDPLEVVAVPDDAPADREAAAAGGPPTRFRYLLGTAIQYVSRIRPAIRLGQTPAADAPAAEGAPPQPAAAPVASLLPFAQLCTKLASARGTDDVAPLLEEAAAVLEAVGLIVWMWDPRAGALTPALSHGYSDTVLAQLPTVRRSADNATAAAFRSNQTCVVKGSDLASGALVVPLMTPRGCIGVLAVELPHGTEERESMRALGTIIAALLGALMERRPAKVSDRGARTLEPAPSLPGYFSRRA